MFATFAPASPSKFGVIEVPKVGREVAVSLDVYSNQNDLSRGLVHPMYKRFL